MPDTPNAPQARIHWDDDGQPISTAFDDVYFSKVSGIEETHYVFLEKNRLPERWRTLADDAVFVIAETGFGTGLNFICAWQQWLELAPANAHLHFISTEKFPLSQADLARAAALWPSHSNCYQALVEQYPSTTPGFHSLVFQQPGEQRPRVTLTLIIDDAAKGFSQLQRSDFPGFERPQGWQVDAWFLDGFAPAKNPQMWTQELFQSMALLSGKGSTAATFTAAGIVKRGLRDAGFAVSKEPGFGRKREMLTACVQGACIQEPASEAAAEQTSEQRTDTAHKASFRPSAVAPPWHLSANTHATTPTQALVIGGGLAGTSSAWALANQGLQVTLIERHDALAQEASGNPQGVLHTRFAAEDSAFNRYSQSSFQYALSHYRQLVGNDSVEGQLCGVLQLLNSDKAQQQATQTTERYAAFPDLLRYLTAAEASQCSGLTLDNPALHYPTAGWLNPASVCNFYSQHPAIRLQLNTDVLQLQATSNGWTLLDAHGDILASAPLVVIANAADASQFEQTRHLPLQTIRGQTSYLPASDASRQLQTVICADRYIAPAANGYHCFGATFNLKENSRELRSEDHQENLDRLFATLPQLATNSPDAAQLDGRTGFRCATPDRMPIVGPVIDYAPFVDTYRMLEKNALATIPQAAPCLPGLFVNLGHGSRGITSTPFCASLLASLITQQPALAPWPMVQSLSPARFVIRDIIRHRLKD